MFNMFPFNFSQIFNCTNFTSGTNFTSFTSFTSFTGPSGFNSMNQPQYPNEFGNLISDFLGGIDLEKLYSEYNKALNSINEELNNMNEELAGKEEYNFIEFEEFQDMYLLKIDLTGIDLRELSIKYDPGTIKVRLKRAEIENPLSYLGYGDQRIVKKDYSKTFDNIEDIDLSKVYKNIDNGIYILNMPKKYMLDSGSKIIDIDSYSVQSDKPEIIEVKNKKEEY